jgi:uroporphyrinogen decarboxylase
MESGAAADVLFDAYTATGCDIVWSAPGSGNLVVQALGGKLNFRAKGSSDVAEAPIKTIDEIDGINLAVLKTDVSLTKIKDISKAVVRKTGNEYAAGATMWGPVTLAGLLFGVENFMRGVYKNQNMIHRLLDWTGDVFITYTENYIEAGIDLIEMGEPNASGDMISKKHFAEFVVPVLQKIFTALRKQNSISCLHICGATTDRFDLIAQTGADIFSMDYKASLAKARAVLDGKMAFAGNMDPVAVMLNETPEGVTRASRHCIAEAGMGSGFMLMPGCDIPPATPAENIKAMTDSCRSA